MMIGDVPFELVGKVAGAGAVAEPGDVERGAASRRHRQCFCGLGAGCGAVEDEQD